MQAKSICVLIGLAVGGSFNATLQTARGDDATAEYETLRKSWDDLNGKLDKLTAQFRAAAADEREEIRKEFTQLVGQAEEMLPNLREKAVAAYKANPNKDSDLSKLLIGMAANANRKDRYSAAAELTSLLIENQCSEPALYEQAGAAAYCLDDFEKANRYLNKAKAAGAITPKGSNYLSDVELAEELWAKEQEIRQAEAASDDLPRVLLKTSQGDITVELYENEAPDTVGNFVSLVEDGYYDGLTFHRVLPGFMAQGGCPEGTGSGGPGYNIYCECYEEDHRKHFAGSLSMAKGRARDTGGSQFFLTFQRTPHLDGMHTVFGRVVEGMDVLEKLQRIDPNSFRQKPQPDKIVEAKVLRKRDHEYKPNKVE